MASYINAKVGIKIRPLFFSAPSRAAFSGYISHAAKVQLFFNLQALNVRKYEVIKTKGISKKNTEGE